MSCRKVLVERALHNLIFGAKLSVATIEIIVIIVVILIITIFIVVIVICMCMPHPEVQQRAQPKARVATRLNPVELRATCPRKLDQPSLGLL